MLHAELKTLEILNQHWSAFPFNPIYTTTMELEEHYFNQRLLNVTSSVYLCS